MSISFLKPSAVVLAGILGIGFLPVANAKVLWVDIEGSGKYYCPDVCKTTKHFHSEHPEYNVPYAVPSGIHQEATKVRGEEQVFFVCAAHLRGWHIGYNIKFNSNSCYITTHKMQGDFFTYYYCLCSDTPVEPIKKR